MYQQLKPETGLAEWTSRIKAMQAQVDADEEAEQKKLEEEIAASRLARMSRRSRVGGNSVDLTQKTDITAALREAEAPQPSTDKQKNQDDTLRKLTSGIPSSTIVASGLASSKGPEPMSLAAFMGGRASGPRLNKPAPQPDAHDPTLFEQRTHITAPHPVFGRGGIAMPGMRGRAAATGEVTGSIPRSGTSGVPERERRISTSSSVARRYTEKLEAHAEQDTRPAIASQRKETTLPVRERTLSTPSGVSASPYGTQSPQPRYTASPRPPSRSSVHDLRSGIDAAGRPAPTAVSKTPPSSSPPLSTRPHSTAAPVSPPSKSPITPYYLAGPIKPEPKPPLQGPQIPASKNPSPAFQRVSSPKDPTPSISRLQGRGFVQSVVKASSQLETTTSGPSPSDKPRVPSDKKKSVLDRWPGAGSPTSSVHSIPSPPPQSIPLSRSRTVAPASDALSASAELVKPDLAPKTLRGSASSPSLAQTPENTLPADRTRHITKKKSITEDEANKKPGLGSSSTMISYIKPVKTGDNPQTDAIPRPAESAAGIDELGVRVNYGNEFRGKPRQEGYVKKPDLPSPSRTPLSHPTKDRAKRPRKVRSTPHGSHVDEDAQPCASDLSGGAEAQPAVRTVPGPSSVDAPSSQLSPPLKEPPSQTPPNLLRKPSSSRVTDRWLEPTIIGVKPSGSVKASAPPPDPAPAQRKENNAIRRALPGLVSTVPTQGAPVNATAPSQNRNGQSSLPQKTPREPPLIAKSARAPSIESGNVNIVEETNLAVTPTSPIRPARIPVTGNRPTVMDVAEALKGQAESSSSAEAQVAGKHVADPRISLELEAPRSPVLSRADRGLSTPSPQIEKRKSSYEKYSSIMMPPLQEERTPVSSPAGSLKWNGPQPEPAAKDMSKQTLAADQSIEVPASNVQNAQKETDQVFFDYVDKPLPAVNVQMLVEQATDTFTPDPDTLSISVDVMSILGAASTAITQGTNVFYDAEILVIVHRSKSKSHGLVSTQVWGWIGKRSQLGEREERKMHDLAKRYGTALVIVKQHSEPLELVHALQNKLIIRQGTRAHWTAENTAIHVIRSNHGIIFIDELDFNVKNLCSGFSYCCSILNNIYVWHGVGSPGEECHAALEYAKQLAPVGSIVKELHETDIQRDEMFWMMLGNDDYAKADYWKWRPQIPSAAPRIWRVDCNNVNEPVCAISYISGETNVLSGVYILDCVWEYFILIGSKARGHRLDIRLAISTAMAMSVCVTPSRPFSPTIHTLILPSQIPNDLRLTFRDLDENSLNEGQTPDHMNILPCAAALEHLRKSAWEKAALQDEHMLPLGVQPSPI